MISLTPWSAWLETQQQLHAEQLQVEAERQEAAGGRTQLPFLQVMQVEHLACEGEWCCDLAHTLVCMA